jgi:hypothetical protein
MDALQFRQLVFWNESGLAIVIFVGREDADKMRIQRVDDFLFGERTRPQRKGTPSAPARGHSTVVGEKKHGAIMFFGQPQSVPDVASPADVIHASFGGVRGAERDALLNLSG